LGIFGENANQDAVRSSLTLLNLTISVRFRPKATVTILCDSNPDLQKPM